MIVIVDIGISNIGSVKNALDFLGLNNKVSDKVIYLSAIDEENFVIAQANAEIDKKGKFENQIVSCRKNGEFINAEVDSID